MNQEQLKASAIDGAVRQALVEVYTLREAGLPPTVSSSLDDNRGLIATKSAKIFEGTNGKPQIEWSDKGMRGALVQALTTHQIEASADMNTLEQESAMAEQRLATEDTPIAQHDEIVRSPEEAETLFPNGSSSETSTTPLDGNVETQTLRPERSSLARSKEENSWHRIRFDSEDTKFSVSADWLL